MKKLFIILSTCFVLAGCDGEIRPQTAEQEAIKESWAACINQGGIPIGSWFNSGVLSECKFPPNHD